MRGTGHAQTHDRQPEALSWRERWYEIIFEADTPAGKLFDVLLLIAVLFSVLVVMCESVAAIREAHPKLLVRAEWFFTLLFTLSHRRRHLERLWQLA